LLISVAKPESFQTSKLYLFVFNFSLRDADTDSVNTMVVHEDEGEEGEGEQAGGYGDQTMLVQRVSHLCIY